MRLFLLAAAQLAVAMTIAAPVAAIEYPVTAKVAQADVIHGITVADPYRWLENDVRTDKQVEAWVAAENKVTQAYLATLPRRAAIKARLTQLYDYERFMLPTERGGHVFYRRNSGLQKQFVLYVQDGAGAPRVLLDPNGWSKDGATALAEWAPSRDGRHVVYAVQDGGTDWRTVHVVDVASGKVLADKLDWVKFSELAWNADGSGFYYSRYPQTPGGTDFRSEVFDHAVFFHRIGTPQGEDTKIFATPENRGYYNPAVVSADGRWLVLLSSTGSDDRYEVRIKDLAQPEAPIRTLVAKRDADYRFAGVAGHDAVFRHQQGCADLSTGGVRRRECRCGAAHRRRGRQGDDHRQRAGRRAFAGDDAGGCQDRGAPLFHGGRGAGRCRAAGHRHRQRLRCRAGQVDDLFPVRQL